MVVAQFDVGATIKLDVCDITKDWLDPLSLQPNLVRTAIFKFTDGCPLMAYSKQDQGYNLNATTKQVDGMTDQVVEAGKRGGLRFLAARFKVTPPLLNFEKSRVEPNT